MRQRSGRGVGFSGGEPLLVQGRLLSFVQRIKERFGKKTYVWVYTNGDVIDTTRLHDLRKAGCDEIRINLSARNYDLAPWSLPAE